MNALLDLDLACHRGPQVDSDIVFAREAFLCNTRKQSLQCEGIMGLDRNNMVYIDCNGFVNEEIIYTPHILHFYNVHSEPKAQTGSLFGPADLSRSRIYPD